MLVVTTWAAAVICGSVVSTGIIGTVLWWQAETGGWTTIAVPRLLMAVGALIGVVQIATLVVAEVLNRVLGIIRIIGGTSSAAALMFGYISFIIITWNPTGRGYMESIMYAGPDILILVLACAVGGLVSGLILQILQRAGSLTCDPERYI